MRTLFRMFYPLENSEQDRWAAILGLPDAEYSNALAREAGKHGLTQRAQDGASAWIDARGRTCLLFFRIVDPTRLGDVKHVYEVLERTGAPLAYTFVQQIPDGEGTWDIFHMSRLTYLAHCNRVSGPGSTCDP